MEMKIDTSTSPFTSIKWEVESGLPYQLIAGPCSAENEAQTLDTARSLHALGVRIYRASLWKPRTRPGGFEGVGERGIPWLKRVHDELGMQVATEVAMPSHVDAMLKAGLSTFWIGARTTTSPFAITELAEALRGVDATVLVKNPISPDLELWEGALMRLSSSGVTNIGAIHRGFRTYGQSQYRNTPLWQIPIELKRRHPDLTLLSDPSHITGRRDLVESLSRFALEMHFDGLIIESHTHPDEALSDSAQQITPRDLGEILLRLKVPQLCENGDDEILVNLRREIDLVDAEILQLLRKRMEIVRRIGVFKGEHNLCPMQLKRYRALLSERIKQGTALGLSETLVHELYSSIHEASIHIQQSEQR